MSCVDVEEKELLELGIKNAVEAELGLSLEQYLLLYSFEALEVVATWQEVDDYTELEKADLVKVLAAAILDEERISREMTIMGEEEFQFLRDLAHGANFAGQAVHPERYGYACRLGYVVLVVADGVLYYEMPHEVRALFLDIQTDAFLREMADYRLKWTYLSGLSNLYGMVSMADVVKLYNEYTEESAAEEDMQRVLDLFCIRPQVTQMIANYVVNVSLTEENGFEQLSECIAGLPAYIPSEEEILDYADDMYFEWTPELDKLESYLAEAFPELEDEDVRQLVEEIQLDVMMELDFQEIIELFEAYELKFSSIEQVTEISLLITDVINNTRLWTNRGYTPKELHALNGTPLQEPPEIEAPRQQPIRVQKIGRNEPCPCGSGKKYKKCCGR